MTKWRSIPGYPMYMVSDEGTIWSKRKKGMMTPNTKGTGGYPKVHLSFKGNHKSFTIHRLVLIAFIGLRPRGYESAHLNGVCTDNRLSNLAYVTTKENNLHKKIHGTQSRGVEIGVSKLNEDKVREIRRYYVPNSKDNNTRALAKRYGVGDTAIWRIVRNKTWRHVKPKGASDG